MSKISWIGGRWLVAALLMSLIGSVMAEVSPGATDDRAAKQALPVGGKALLYIYRKQDDHDAASAVQLNGQEATRLDPETFGLWNVDPGRLVISAEGKTLALDCESGRIYFVEFARSTVGGVSLRQVSYAVGRTQTHRARLAGSSARASAPAPARRPEPATVKPTPTKASESAPAAGEFGNAAVAIKFGSFKLSTTSQSILSRTWTFDDAASSPYALEVEVRVTDQFAVGAEYMSYSTSFVQGASTGEIAVSLATVNGKFYFLPSHSAWRPYFGIGLGGATGEFSGAITGDMGGVAYDAILGLQWRMRWFGVRAEYKLLKAELEDSGSQTADVSGSGLFLGASFHF